MTKRQQQVLDFLRDFLSVKGYAPSIREVATYLGCAPTTAARFLAALERGGHIGRAPRVARGVCLRTPVRFDR